MEIMYAKVINSGTYPGEGYVLKHLVMCCAGMQEDLINNRINMCRWNPYVVRDYELCMHWGCPGNNEIYIPIKYCPHCGQPISLKKVQTIHKREEVYSYAEEINNKWDQFETYDFNKSQRFYGCRFFPRNLLHESEGEK